MLQASALKEEEDLECEGSVPSFTPPPSCPGPCCLKTPPQPLFASFPSVGQLCPTEFSDWVKNAWNAPPQPPAEHSSLLHSESPAQAEDERENKDKVQARSRLAPTLGSLCSPCPPHF